MLTTRYPEQKCPECGKPLDAVSSVYSDQIANVGDTTICIGCAAIMIFEVGMTLRLATNDELRKLTPEHLFDLVKAQTAVREMHRQRRRSNWANN